MKRMSIVVTPKGKNKQDDENHLYTECEGLSGASVEIEIENDTIINIIFEGRPKIKKIGERGSHDAHIKSVETIKKEIIEKYKGKLTSEINVSFFRVLPNIMSKEEEEWQLRRNRLAAIGKKIANEFIDKCRDKENIYSSDPLHNEFLNHLNQKLKENEKIPFNIPILQKYHAICQKKYPTYFKNGRLEIPDEKALNIINKSCFEDNPENNPYYVEKMQSRENTLNKFLKKQKRDKPEKSEELYGCRTDINEPYVEDKTEVNPSSMGKINLKTNPLDNFSEEPEKDELNKNTKIYEYKSDKNENREHYTFFPKTDTKIDSKLCLTTFGYLLANSNEKFNVDNFNPETFLMNMPNSIDVKKQFCHEETHSHESSSSDRYYSSHKKFNLIHVASHLGKIKLAENLLLRGSDINAIMEYFNWIRIDHIDLMGKRVLDKSNDINERTVAFKTPLDIAHDKGNQDLIKFLTEHGAKTYKQLQENSYNSNMQI